MPHVLTKIRTKRGLWTASATGGPLLGCEGWCDGYMVVGYERVRRMTPSSLELDDVELDGEILRNA
jgi:hypothetical protein